jgi:hypothetical protein
VGMNDLRSHIRLSLESYTIEGYIIFYIQTLCSSISGPSCRDAGNTKIRSSLLVPVQYHDL